MPAGNGVGVDDRQAACPRGPRGAKCDPERSVHVVECRARPFLLERRHLLPESKVSITMSARHRQSTRNTRLPRETINQRGQSKARLSFGLTSFNFTTFPWSADPACWLMARRSSSILRTSTGWSARRMYCGATIPRSAPAGSVCDAYCGTVGRHSYGAKPSCWSEAAGTWTHFALSASSAPTSTENSGFRCR